MAAPAFVLVHSPLVGPLTWRGVADELERRGHPAVAPSLQDATAAGPPYVERHAAAVAAAVRDAGLEGAPVVVGHSGAGPLLPAVGAALDPSVAAYVFVDAGLPMPGRSQLDEMHPSFRAKLRGMVEDGRLPTWDRWWDAAQLDALFLDDELRERFVADLRPVPLGLFTERLPSVPDWPDAPCAYLRLSEAYRLEEASAARSGWAVSRLPGSHLEPLVRPQAVADAVLALLRRLEVG